MLGRLDMSENVGMVNNLKDPRRVVPTKLWIGLQQEVGPVPNLVAELVRPSLVTSFLPSRSC